MVRGGARWCAMVLGGIYVGMQHIFRGQKCDVQGVGADSISARKTGHVLLCLQTNKGHLYNFVQKRPLDGAGDICGRI